MRDLVIKSEKKRLVSVIVYRPNMVDTDVEAMTPDDIETLAHQFWSDGKVYKVDLEHNEQETGCPIVESFVARKGDPDFPVGSWVVVIKVASDMIWDGIQKGEINGVSWKGKAARVPVLARVMSVKKAEGTTELSVSESFPVHDHPMIMKFNPDGTVIPGHTGEAEGHIHIFNRTTAVEPNLDHGHRVKIEG